MGLILQGCYKNQHFHSLYNFCISKVTSNYISILIQVNDISFLKSNMFIRLCLTILSRLIVENLYKANMKLIFDKI